MVNNLNVIMGAAAIAKELGISRRQCYGLIYAGELKTVKLGGTVAITRQRLTEWVEKLNVAA